MVSLLWMWSVSYRQYVEAEEICQKSKEQYRILIEQMTAFDSEFIVSLHEDPVFGKVLMFGLGGICRQYDEQIQTVEINPIVVDEGFTTGINPEVGSVSFISQSGGITTEMLRAVSAQGIRLNKAVSIGNCAGLGIEEFLSHMADDP